jgi:hypothetical protein
MSSSLYPPSRPQSIAEVLDSAFRVFRATLLRCLPYGALAVVAGQLPNIYDIAAGRPLRRFGAADPVWWALYLIGALLALGLWNATALRQYGMLTGTGTAAAGADLSRGLRRAPVVALLLTLSLAAMGVFLLPALLVPPGWRVGILLLLALPASYVGVALSCSWTALLFAGTGVLGSMAYSFRLVSGNWWRLSTIYTVGIVMLLVFYVLSGVLAMAVVVPFAGAADLAVLTAVSAVVVVALGAVGTPFYSALALVVFGDLRARREALEVERRMAAAAAE